jgi:hypothetical protein
VPNSRRIIVIAKLRPFDEAAWKRLLIAYSYTLYDKQRKLAAKAVTADEAGTS